jgi:hypothetical protein
MMGEFERAARERQINDFSRWLNAYHEMESKLPVGFTSDEVRDADRFQDALERPTLAILDTVEQLVRATVLDMMDARTDAQGLTAHDRKMFSTLKVKY